MADEKVAVKPKTKKYRLTGRSHDGFEDDGVTRKRFVTGDMVSLTQDQFKAFEDKFEDPRDRNNSGNDEPEVTPTLPAQKAGKDQVKTDVVPEGSNAKENPTDQKPAGTQQGAGSAAHSSNTAKV